MLSQMTGYISVIAEFLQIVMFLGMGGLILFLLIWITITYLRTECHTCNDPSKEVESEDSLSQVLQKVFYQACTRENEDDSKVGKNRNIRFEVGDSGNPNETASALDAEIIGASFRSAVQPPKIFIQDAVFQYGMSIFEDKMLAPYEALVNLFPPIGFLGTILGMTMLFIDQDGSIKEGLSSAGMGTALLSTIFALVAYVVFESLKMLLQRRARRNISASIAQASHSYDSQGQGNEA